MSGSCPEVRIHPEVSMTSLPDQVFSVIVLGPGANSELVPKFHVALNVLLKQSPQHLVI